MTAIANAIVLSSARTPRREVRCNPWYPASDSQRLEMPFSFRTILAATMSMGLGAGLIYLTLS